MNSKPFSIILSSRPDANSNYNCNDNFKCTFDNYMKKEMTVKKEKVFWIYEKI